jgi:hypothetical protein
MTDSDGSEIKDLADWVIGLPQPCFWCKEPVTTRVGAVPFRNPFTLKIEWSHERCEAAGEAKRKQQELDYHERQEAKRKQRKAERLATKQTEQIEQTTLFPKGTRHACSNQIPVNRREAESGSLPPVNQMPVK